MQATRDFGGREPVDAQDLARTAMAAHDSHRPGRQAEDGCEQRAHRVVRTPSLWGRRHLHAQDVAGEPGNPRTRRLGNHLHVDQRPAVSHSAAAPQGSPCRT